MTTTNRMPDARVRTGNRFVTMLLRLGVPLGPMRLLTVTGRRSGMPRTTPVATFTFEGGPAFPRASWVQNARIARQGLLGRGRRMRQVALVEVPVEERRAILRHLGRTTLARRARGFVENGLVESTDPEA